MGGKTRSEYMFSELPQIADIVGVPAARTALGRTSVLRDERGPDPNLSHGFCLHLFTLHAPERAKLHAAEWVHCERDAAAAFGPMAPPDGCSVAPSQEG